MARFILDIQRRAGHRHAPRRARHGAGDGHRRPRDGARLRRQDRRGHAGRGAARPGRDRRLPRRRGRVRRTARARRRPGGGGGGHHRRGVRPRRTHLSPDPRASPRPSADAGAAVDGTTLGARRRRFAVALRQRGGDPPADRRVGLAGAGRGCGSSTPAGPADRSSCSRPGRRPTCASSTSARIGHPPLMFRPPGPVPHEPIDDFEIRPVTDDATARDWEDALVHGYIPSRRCSRSSPAASSPTRPRRTTLATLGGLPGGRGGRHRVGVRG